MSGSLGVSLTQTCLDITLDIVMRCIAGIAALHNS